MFQIIATISKEINNSTLSVTPIMGANKKRYFLPSELGEQLGYEDLPHSILTSNGFREGVHYEVFRGAHLKSLKTLMLQHSVSLTDRVISPNAPSIILLTEPGVWALLAKSEKPAARPFQDFMFVEVMPKISSTGSYSIAGNKLKERRNDLRDALEVIKSYKKIGKFYGVAPIDVQKETLKEIKELSGLDFSKVFSLFPLEVEEKALDLIDKFFYNLYDSGDFTEEELKNGLSCKELASSFNKTYKGANYSLWKFSREVVKKINNKGLPFVYRKRTNKCNKICVVKK